jgi:hypothetical protein
VEAVQLKVAPFVVILATVNPVGGTHGVLHAAVVNVIIAEYILDAPLPQYADTCH